MIIVLLLISLSALHSILSWLPLNSQVNVIPSGYVNRIFIFFALPNFSVIFPEIVNIPWDEHKEWSIDSEINVGKIFVSSLFLYLLVNTGSNNISSFGTPHILSELLYFKGSYKECFTLLLKVIKTIDSDLVSKINKLLKNWNIILFMILYTPRNYYGYKKW